MTKTNAQKLSLLSVSVILVGACNAAPTADPTRTPVATIAVSSSTDTPSAEKPKATAAKTTATPRPTKVALAYPLCSELKPELNATRPDTNNGAGKIVFLATDGNVSLTNADGSDTVSVTNDGFVDREKQTGKLYQFPTFSNDGDSLAFVSTQVDGAGTFTQTVHVAAAKAKAPLTDLYATNAKTVPYLDWSPDSESVAFLTIGGGGGEMRVAKKTGGAVTVIDTGSSVYWHWRNDSSSVVAHLGGVSSANGGDAHISVVDGLAAGGTQGKLTRIESLPGRFQSPQFSPSGKHMLFVLATEREIDDLILADARGTPLCTVTRMEGGAFFAWSPDGMHLAYLDTVSPARAPSPLVIWDLATYSRKQIDRSGVMFFWSPDGSNIALYSVTDEGAVTQMGNTENPSSQKQNKPAAQTVPKTALRVEVVDVKTGKAIKVADTLPTQEFFQFFQYFDQYSRAVTPWSPDSQRLVFVSVNDDKAVAEIGVATPNAGNTFEIKRVAEGSLAFWSPK